MEKTNTILRRIHEVRKIKQRNIHDCAAFLNISKEDYLQFENGTKMLTLPEIELLAYFFDVSPLLFFQTDHWESQKLEVLDNHVQPQYTALRQKVIQAKIIDVMHRESITSEQIQEDTDISISDLNAYQKGEKSIPLDHLLEISEVLGLSEEDLIQPASSWQEDESAQALEHQWQREFSSTRTRLDAEEDSSDNQLMIAFQKLSKKDQAELAKSLLQKLKSNKDS